MSREKRIVTARVRIYSALMPHGGFFTVSSRNFRYNLEVRHWMLSDPDGRAGGRLRRLPECPAARPGFSGYEELQKGEVMFI